MQCLLSSGSSAGDVSVCSERRSGDPSAAAGGAEGSSCGQDVLGVCICVVAHCVCVCVCVSDPVQRADGRAPPAAGAAEADERAASADVQLVSAQSDRAAG